MKTVKNIVFRLLRRLIFSFFLISVLFAVFGIQKINAQIVGLEKSSKAQLIKNLEEQIDIQKTQLDTIKTNLESLKLQIAKDEESNKTIDAQKEFRSQMAADKEQIKAPVVEFLAQQPELSSDKEIVDKFSGAKKAMEKHEQDFISKIEVKEEPEKTSAPAEVAEPAKPYELEVKEEVEEFQKPAEEPVVTEQATLTASMPAEPTPAEQEVAAVATPSESTTPQAPIAEPQPAVEEVKPVEPEQLPIISPEVQTISKEMPQMPISQPVQEVAMPKPEAEEVAKTPEFQPESIPAQSEPVTLPGEKAE